MAPGGISATRDDDLPSLDGGVAPGEYDRRGGRRPPRGGRGRESGPSSLATNLILMLVVAGLGVVGWFLFNQQKLITEAEAARDAAESRLAVLEERLRATDEVMSDAGDETKEQLGFWESEIRKVWDIAYKVNRGWIKENQALLAEHKNQLASVTSSLGQLRSTVTAQGDSAESVAKRLEQLDEISAKIEGVTAGQDKLAKNIAEIDTSALTERVLRNEQAVAAIDAYRVQLNRRLTDLQGRIDAMGPVADGAP